MRGKERGRGNKLASCFESSSYRAFMGGYALPVLCNYIEL